MGRLSSSFRTKDAAGAAMAGTTWRTWRPWTTQSRMCDSAFSVRQTSMAKGRSPTASMSWPTRWKSTSSRSMETTATAITGLAMSCMSYSPRARLRDKRATHSHHASHTARYTLTWYLLGGRDLGEDFGPPPLSCWWSVDRVGGVQLQDPPVQLVGGDGVIE